MPGSTPTTTALSPEARRAQRPRWFDVRLLIGLVLVIGSVVLGARIVSAGDETVSVWAVTGDLAAGTTLTAADLTAIDVALHEHAGSYVAATSDVTGRVLNRDISGGDLLPSAAIAEDVGLVELALSVPASNVPVSVARGDRVSIYATAPPAPPAPGAQAEAGATTLVVEAAPVADLSERSQGALSVGSGDLQIVVRLPECAITGVLDGTVDRVLTVVEVPASSRNEQAC